MVAESSFSSHIRDAKWGGVSEFARTKTLAEQREILPIFSCREDLLQLIRENSGALYNIC